MITIFLIILLQTYSAQSNILESCLSQGFDPISLSCDTCTLLRATDYHLTCLECCQSYKKLDSRTSRYNQAVLLHNAGSEEIDKFVNEELETVQQSKRGFFVKKAEAIGFFPMPSILYFFKHDAPSSGDSSAYADSAHETIVLHGWGKDDLRDMIETLLPDKN